MLPPGGSICGRLTQDLPQGCLQGGSVPRGEHCPSVFRRRASLLGSAPSLPSVLGTLDCVLDTLDCVLDTLDCVLDTLDCVLDTLDCVLDTHARAKGGCARFITTCVGRDCAGLIPVISQLFRDVGHARVRPGHTRNLLGHACMSVGHT